MSTALQGLVSVTQLQCPPLCGYLSRLHDWNVHRSVSELDLTMNGNVSVRLTLLKLVAACSQCRQRSCRRAGGVHPHLVPWASCRRKSLPGVFLQRLGLRCGAFQTAVVETFERVVPELTFNG